jgi:hypothetical protein
MLSVNLPLLKQKLNRLIETPPVSESPMYKAAYNAYYEVNKSALNLEASVTDTDLAADVKKQQKQCEQKLKDNAKKFAEEFCKGLKDGDFMGTIADEVDGHIKSMKLFITMMPQGIATIVSPVGPCTGSMIIDDTTASIQIL